MKIIMSGKAYNAACSPLCSGVSKEEGWPEPTWRKVGLGYQYTYEGDVELAELIASHMEIVGEAFVSNDGYDPDTRAEGRALLFDAARIRIAMEKEVQSISRNH